MINDPLLPTFSPMRQDDSSSTSQAKKTKTPRHSAARSAKILTLGLSTTAMLGMTSGYAFADIADKNVATIPPTQSSPIVTQAVTPQSLAPSEPRATTSLATAPAVVAPQQGTIIEVPIPSSEAIPGNGNSGWAKQKSSGSN